MKNSNLMEGGILSKIKSWLNKFSSKSHNNKNVHNIELHSNDIEQATSQKAVQNIFEEYRQMNNRRQYLLELQEKLEKDIILEKDLNNEDKVDLEKLYIEQINELQRTIHNIKINKMK